ncbi:MAG: hypothetical protein MJE68_00515, partial [Proteobacteria bacterium]|nr:hypothetical protein [Pseudomonadota bacterium]
MKKEIEHLNKVAEQQKGMIENQEKLIIMQGKELELRTVPTEFKEKKSEERIEKIVHIDEQGNVMSEGSCRIENILPSNLMKFLPKKEVVEEKPTEKIIPAEEVESVVTTAPSISNVYLPHVKETNVVLVQSTQQKTTERRAGLTRPVPKGIRHDKRFYCERCKSHFVRKDLLSYHIRNECMKTVREFICEECHKGFYGQDAVTEHYYQVHLKTPLYHCKKCNEPFWHKSRRSSHNKGNACPNKEGPNIYKGKLDIPADLAQTFKRRIQLPFTTQGNPQIPEAVPVGSDPQTPEDVPGGSTPQVQQNIETPLQGEIPQQSVGGILSHQSLRENPQQSVEAEIHPQPQMQAQMDSGNPFSELTGFVAIQPDPEDLLNTLSQGGVVTGDVRGKDDDDDVDDALLDEGDDGNGEG